MYRIYICMKLLQDIPWCYAFSNVSFTHLLYFIVSPVQIQICNSFDSEELKHIVSSMHDTWLKLTFQQVSIDFIQCISVSIYTYICMTFGHVLKLIVEAVFH